MIQGTHRYAEMLNAVRMIGDRCPDLLLNYTVHGYTLLHVAATYNARDLTLELFSRGVSFLQGVLGEHGMSFYHIAANEGCQDVLWIARDHGGSESIMRAKDHLGRLPLHYASDQPTTRFICSLYGHKLRKFTHYKDRMGSQALICAARRGAVGAVDCLLSVDAEQHNVLIDTYRLATGWDQIWRRRFALVLPYNVSIRMVDVLSKHGFVVCVRADAERPTTFTTSRPSSYELHERENDEIIDGDYVKNTNPWESLTDDRAVRELRIEKDEAKIPPE